MDRDNIINYYLTRSVSWGGIR